MSSAVMAASLSQSSPSPSRAVGPTQSGLPRDILADGSGFGSRLYRAARRFRWSAITLGLAADSAAITSPSVVNGFSALSGSRAKSNPVIRPPFG
jgi:hypothetical protein